MTRSPVAADRWRSVVLDTARNAGEPWTRPLGDPPRDHKRRQTWRRHARTIAAYRDRYGLTDDTPLGATPEATAQKIDAVRARTALARAQESARLPEQETRRRPPVGQERVGPTL